MKIRKTKDAQICCDCEHLKRGFTEESNPTGLYCEISQWAIGIVSYCYTGRFTGTFKRKR